MKSPSLLILMAVITMMAAASGCSTDNNELQRLVCEVSSVNGGAPLVSAYLNAGNDKMVGTDDDFLPIDIVSVLFHARALNTQLVIPDNGTYSSFHVTSYDLIWHPGPNAPAELTNFNVTGAPSDAMVPVDDDGMVSILVADRGMKEQSWFRALYDDWFDSAPPSFSAFLEINFHGHESSSEHEVVIPAGLTVTFFGVVTES